MRSNPISIRNGLNNSWLIKTKDHVGSEVIKKLIFSLIKRFDLSSVINCETVLTQNCIICYIYFYKYDNQKMYRNMSFYERKIAERKERKKARFRKITRKLIYDFIFEKVKFLVTNNNMVFIILRQNLPASCIVNYILFRLSHKFGIFSILRYTFLKELITVKWNTGLIIECSGRFTRKERGSHYFILRGSTSPTTIENNINYTSKLIPLKYGVCNIKIWLHSDFRKI